MVYVNAQDVITPPPGSPTYTCVGFRRHMPRGLRNGGLCPKLLGRILTKIAIRIADNPIFTARQLLPPSAGFLLEPPYIDARNSVDIRHVARGKGTAPNVPESDFSYIRGFQRRLSYS